MGPRVGRWGPGACAALGYPAREGARLQSPPAPALVLWKYWRGPGGWGAGSGGEAPRGRGRSQPRPPASRRPLPPPWRPARPLPLLAGQGPVPAPPPARPGPSLTAGGRRSPARPRSQVCPRARARGSPLSPAARQRASAVGVREAGLGAQAPPTSPSPLRRARRSRSVWSAWAGTYCDSPAWLGRGGGGPQVAGHF